MSSDVAEHGLTLLDSKNSKVRISSHSMNGKIVTKLKAEHIQKVDCFLLIYSPRYVNSLSQARYVLIATKLMANKEVGEVSLIHLVSRSLKFRNLLSCLGERIPYL